MRSLCENGSPHKNQNHQDHTGDYQIDIRHIANGPAIVKEIHHFAVEEAVSVHNTVNQVAQSACKREKKSPPTISWRQCAPQPQQGPRKPQRPTD